MKLLLVVAVFKVTLPEKVRIHFEILQLFGLNVCMEGMCNFFYISTYSFQFANVWKSAEINHKFPYYIIYSHYIKT